MRTAAVPSPSLSVAVTRYQRATLRARRRARLRALYEGPIWVRTVTRLITKIWSTK